MDLDTIRKTLAEKQEARERVGAEADELRRQLATISKAARAAEHRSEEMALLAVIDPNLSADAEKAKAALVSAFEQETEARDRLGLLDRALHLLDDEIAALEARLPSVADAKVAEVLTSRLSEIDEMIVQATALAYARAKAHGALHYEISGPLIDRLQGDGNRPGLRTRVLDAAAKIRAEITGGAR